jgi:hypothetical protein
MAPEELLGELKEAAAEDNEVGIEEVHDSAYRPAEEPCSLAQYVSGERLAGGCSLGNRAEVAPERTRSTAALVC